MTNNNPESKRILFVDDDESYRMLYEDKFVDAGFEVILAEDKQSATEKLEERPDVVILDYTLPDGDGDEILEDIRSRDSEWAQEVPIFMLTQHDDVTKVADTVSNGAQGYFVKKDVTVDELVDEINRHF